MEDLAQIDWTNFANGLGVLFLALVTTITGVMGYKKLSPQEPPAAVNASLIDTKMLERGVQSFESLARVMEREMVQRDSLIESRQENARELAENTQVMRTMFVRMDEMQRVMGDLVYQLNRSNNK